MPGETLTPTAALASAGVINSQTRSAPLAGGAAADPITTRRVETNVLLFICAPHFERPAACLLQPAEHNLGDLPCGGFRIGHLCVEECNHDPGLASYRGQHRHLRRRSQARPVSQAAQRWD